MSASKFVDANYIKVLIPEEVLIYDENEVKLRASGQAILTGWRCKKSGLWRVPLKSKVKNENVYTMRIKLPDPGRYINNVYETPSTEQYINYLHACTGFQKKATQIKATRLGNYTTWPVLTIKSMNKYLLESEETKK